MFTLEFEYVYRNKTTKPICNMYLNGDWFECLFDTGADVSVIDERLYDHLKPVLRYKRTERLSVFGGKGKDVRFYSVDNLILSDGKTNIVLTNFPVYYDEDSATVHQLVLAPSFCAYGECSLKPSENIIRFDLPSNHYVFDYLGEGVTRVQSQFCRY